MVGQASDACDAIGHTLDVCSSEPQGACGRLGKHSGACATLGLSLAASLATRRVAAAISASIPAPKPSLAKAKSSCDGGTSGHA